MSIKKFSMLLLSAMSLAALLNGCGSSSKEGAASPADVAKVDEATCAQCHGSSYSSQSGMPIYSEYVQSKHFQNSAGIVVGCQGCHGGGAQHNGVGPIPYPNPDSAGKCFGCHKPAFLGTYNTGGTPTAIEMAHFYNITGAGVHPAMYATKNFQNNCTACHEPHNPLLGKGAAERKAWASEGHGDINSTAFATEDFKQNTSCIRCHTSTGYSNFLAGQTGGPKAPWSDPFPATTWATPGDNGREVVTCRTCHFNDSFNANSVKSAPAFVAPYNNNKNPKTFPDVAQSNLCIACHSARESGDTIAAVTDFSNSSFKNSHYKASAATMFMANAFINFTSLSAKVPTNNEGSALKFAAATYGRTLLPNSNTIVSKSNGSVTPGIAFGTFSGTTSTHRKLGTTAIDYSEDYLNPSKGGSLGINTNGPCVTCHLKADNPVASTNGGVTFTPPAAGRPAHGHSWQIDDATGNELCLQCHNDGPNLKGGDGNGNAITVQYQTFADLVSTQLDPQREAFQDGLNLIQQLLLANYKISFDINNYPYFYDENLPLKNGKKQALTDWTRGTNNQVFGKKIMGACFNFNLLTREPGAYVHARTFSQRLVYDTIDFLDDGKMNFTTLTTARTLNPTIYHGYNINVYVNNALVPANQALATEQMIWLSGTHYTQSKSASATKATDFLPMKLHP
jgi:nitrate reductase cytochrome c-type subunit